MNRFYLTADKLSFAYLDMPVIHEWSGSVSASDLCHLQGSNGSGKTTLLKLLAGILQAESGTLDCEVEVGFVGHHLGIHPMLTVVENLEYSLGCSKLPNLQQQLLDAKLQQQHNRALANLSLGQQHKVAILRLIAQHAKLWLLDEPFANLDHDAESWLWAQIDRHREQGGAVVMTAHQRDFSDRGSISWLMA